MSRSSRPPPADPAKKKSKLVDRARVEHALRGLVADDDDRAFVARCIAREGPPHHQGASYAILALLRLVADRVGATPERKPGPRPSMRVPPHHAASEDEREFAIALPDGAIERIEPDPKRARALAECLLDGPTHHALANVAMVALLDAILDRIEQDERR
jgi:hypothetical protein